MGIIRTPADTTAATPKFPEPADLPVQPNLPDPLTAMDGSKITTAEQWHRQRKPELKALILHYMYGQFLPPLPIEAQVERTDPQAFAGKATLKEVTIRFGPQGTPPIHLLLVVPNARSGPAPVFLGINFCGNHAVVNDPKVRIPTAWIYANYAGVEKNRATEKGRGTQVNTWAIDQSIERGYAVATFYNGDVDPDRPDVREGIQPHLKKGPSSDSDGGTIAAWAWGLHRAVDYLVTDKDLDAKRIAVVGHSRLGKTALLAAAYDERIALAIPSQAGMGGTAPSRGKIGESIEAINTRFPHWFNGNYKKFNRMPERLPFDQNCLLALVAPRPVLFSNAVEDTWANPVGQFEVMKAAEPVYRLLGAGGCDADKMPEPNQLISSTLGYYIRPGKHSMTRADWKVWLDYADKHLKK